MAKNIYKVEGASPAQPPWGSSGSKVKRRKLFWILVGLAILTVAMIVAIAALGASESPAVDTALDSVTTWTAGYVPVTNPGPVGNSTAATAVVEKPSSTASSSGSTSSSSGSTTTTALTHPIADPVRVVIPALKLDAKTVAVGLTNGTEMEIPAVGSVGWYKLGPAPGAAGPAVLVSHVSWKGKKGAFYKLKDLKPGDEIQVYDASGDCAVFQVDASETILKTKLPTERIWNQTDQAVIRLVTCGGAYDSKTGHYLSNVIVYGHLVR